MRRYSLILLVLFLLLINTLMRQAAEANPLTHPDMWGLRHALPAGVAAAALFLAALGMGAQMWRGILPVCGAAWSPQRAWSYLTVGGLWCGWIPLLCALAFYPEAGEGPSRWLVGGFFALVIGRMLTLVFRHPLVGLLTALVTAAVATLCGQILWPHTPMDVMVAGLSASLALYLLFEKEPAPRLVWLLTAALIFCAYVAAFGHMLAFYPPGEEAPASPWGMWMAGGFAVVALASIIFALLRHKLWGRRIVAGLTLAACLTWLWLHVSMSLEPQEQLPALGFFAASLALFGLPFGMMLSRVWR